MELLQHMLVAVVVALVLLKAQVQALVVQVVVVLVVVQETALMQQQILVLEVVELVFKTEEIQRLIQAVKADQAS
jgi:hypothetical protein